MTTYFTGSKRGHLEITFSKDAEGKVNPKQYKILLDGVEIQNALHSLTIDCQPHEIAVARLEVLLSSLELDLPATVVISKYDPLEDEIKVYGD